MFRYRGHTILVGLAWIAIANGGYVASCEVAIIVLIVALSPSGNRIFGLLAEQLQRLSFFKTSFGAALLMALPVKTITALLSAKEADAFSQIAISATSGLIGLAVGLGVLACYLRRRVRNANRVEKVSTPISWIPMLDLGLVLVLLLVSDEGEKVFGGFSTLVKDSFPMLQQPWLRGLLAIIPLKTTTTLLVAGSHRRVYEIAIHGSMILSALAGLTFIAYLMADAGSLISVSVGVAVSIVGFLCIDCFKECCTEVALSRSNA